MLNRKTLALGGGVALLAGAVIVHACGPFFPLQLLDNRAGTLSGTPNNSFAYEASHLVTPADHLQAPEAASVPAGQQPVDPAQAVLALLAVAPPAIVVMVYGSAMGLLDDPMIFGKLIVTLIGTEADPAKPAPPLYVAVTLFVP